MSSKLPAPLYPWVFAAIMGGAMTAIVTAVLALAHGGFALLPWLRSWALAWLVATPVIVFLAPRARRWAARIAELPR
ncbi:MAG TPA: DUF2798 domain-containing protein [Xanthomonadales bacterium]|nr:DUF2798 domain-containing protein [Xanthomonadales bacterium]